ncbi:MAG: hypothetical protein H6739_31965 [Alphaproteobacteria bacterium]|nr:hypothetical protein [Alphaproteobacteria bacterium]
MSRDAPPALEPLPRSLEDRRRLVAERGLELRLLLDEAFTAFCDRRDLHPYGFRGEDPITEAVEWAIDFFASERFQPEKQPVKTLRLFTCVDNWLHLKVGQQAHGARKGWRAADLEPETLAASAVSHLRRAQDVALAETRARLGHTLGVLKARTCAGVVLLWLEGSQRLRAKVFDWDEPVEVRDDGDSKKTRSFRRHDALFRYLCLFIGIVDDASAEDAHRAVVRTSFSPCEDRPPYRVLEATPGTARKLQGLRKRGIRDLLERALDAAEADAVTPEEHLTRLLLRHGLNPTTAHALKLQDEPLLTRLSALPPPEVRR